MADAVEESQIKTFRFEPENFDSLAKLEPRGLAVQGENVPFSGGWRGLYFAAIGERVEAEPGKIWGLVREELAKPKGETRLFYDRETFGRALEPIADGLYVNVGFPTKYLLDNLRFVYQTVGLNFADVTLTCAGSGLALKAALESKKAEPIVFELEEDAVTLAGSRTIENILTEGRTPKACATVALGPKSAPIVSAAKAPTTAPTAPTSTRPIPKPAPKPIPTAPRPVTKTLRPSEQDMVAAEILRDYFQDCVLHGLKERDAFLRIYRERSNSDLNTIQLSRLFKRMSITLTTETPEFPRGQVAVPADFAADDAPEFDEDEQ